MLNLFLFFFGVFVFLAEGGNIRLVFIRVQITKIYFIYSNHLFLKLK